MDYDVQHCNGRFAAVEATDAAHASRAISWVVAGGVVAAFLGPQLGQWGRDWFAGGLFVGSYLAQGALGLVALVLLSQVRLPPVAAADACCLPFADRSFDQVLSVTALCFVEHSMPCWRAFRFGE